jgi:hypothetical protein
VSTSMFLLGVSLPVRTLLDYVQRFGTSPTSTRSEALSGNSCPAVGVSSFYRSCLKTLSVLSWPSFNDNIEASTPFFHLESIW